MNRFLIIVSLIIVVPLLGLYTNPQKIHAQNPVFVEGFFCDDARNAMMHEVFGFGGQPPVTSIWLDCGVNEDCAVIPKESDVQSRNADCVPAPKIPVVGTGTNTYNPTPQVVPGATITFGVTSDRDVGDQCYAQINANDLQVTGRLRSCQVSKTDCGCTTRHVQTCTTSCDPDTHICHQVCVCDQVQDCGPADWHAGTVDDCGETTGVNPYDNRQCFTDITCTTAESTGNFDAPLVTPNKACLNHIAYSIVPLIGPVPATERDGCIVGTHTINAPNNVAANKDRITEDSVADDLENAHKLAAANFPQNVLDSVKQKATVNTIEDPTTHAPMTGVDNIFASFFCSAGGLLQAIFIQLGGVCPEPTLFTGNSLNDTAATTEQLADTSRPDEIAFKSQPQDCAVSEFIKDGVQSDADTKMKTYSKSMGGYNGVYGRGQPEFPQSQLRINKNKTIYSQGRVLDGSLIVSEANAECLQYSQRNNPSENGISFCHDGTTPGANLAPTQIEAPAQVCTTSCPAGLKGTCGGHKYFVFATQSYGPCQCETESQTCTP